MKQLLTERGHTVFAIAWIVLMVPFIVSPWNMLGVAGFRCSWAIFLLLPLWFARSRIRPGATPVGPRLVLLGLVSTCCELAMAFVLVYVYTQAVLEYCPPPPHR
jgi:hypothetical protein